MKTFIKYITLTIFLIGFTKAQTIPNNFNISSEKTLTKINSNSTPLGNSITDIITIGDTIWVATNKGVSSSFNNGFSWNNHKFGTESISALAYNNGIIWVATAHTENNNGSDINVGTGLKYTSDNGITWNSINQPIDKANDTTVVYGINTLKALPVTVPQQNVTFDIAFTPGTVWITSFAGGLRKSTNNGLTWQRVPLPPDNLNSISPTDTLSFCLSPVAGSFCTESNLNHRAFSVISINDSTLYVGTAGGINKSTDNGISWQKFDHQNQTNSISGNFVVALGFNKNNNTLWAATWTAASDEFTAVSLTTDGGSNWTTFLNGEKTHNFGFKGNDVIALSNNGAFRSKDLGRSWITPPVITDNNTNITLTTNTFFSAATNNSNIWLGSNDGLAMLTETIGMWSGNWKLFFASKPLTKSNDNSFAFPNPFSPRIDRLKIKYSTGGKRIPVTIRIFDFSMHYVATVIQNAVRGNQVHEVDNNNNINNGVIDFWDGRDASGKIVPNGVYFYRVEAAGNIQYGKILVIQ